MSKFWTFADNLEFTRKYDLASWVHAAPDPVTAKDSLLDMLPLRPTEDSPWIHYRLRRSWDHLDPVKILATLHRTHIYLNTGRQPPREEWLILGLTALPEDEWCVPQDYYDLIDEVTISVDGDQDFKDDLTRWVCNRNRLPKIKRLLRWIPWG